MKILVVDDSISVRKALERILSTRKLEVVTTGSAEEALQRLPGSNPGLIIADVVMPGMDGFALCHRLKADPDYKHLPVLLISGIVNQEVAHRAEEAGAVGIVKKPFTPEDLFPKIELALAAAAPVPASEGDLSTAVAAHPPVAPTPPAAEMQEVMQAADPSRTAAPDGAASPQPADVWSAGGAPGQHQEMLRGLLQPLLDNGAVDAALLADARGTCLAQVGRGLDDAATLAVYSRTLASIAAALGDTMGVPELGSLQLDFRGQSLLIARTQTRGTLLLRIKDAKSVGVARYLVRKVLEADRFEDPPVLAS